MSDKIYNPGLAHDHASNPHGIAKAIDETQKMVDSMVEDSIRHVPKEHLKEFVARRKEEPKVKGCQLNSHHCLVCGKTDEKIMNKYVGHPYWLLPKASVLPVQRVYRDMAYWTTIEPGRLGYVHKKEMVNFVANLCSEKCADILDTYMTYPNHYSTCNLTHIQGKIEQHLMRLEGAGNK